MSSSKEPLTGTSSAAKEHALNRLMQEFGKEYSKQSLEQVLAMNNNNFEIVCLYFFVFMLNTRVTGFFFLQGERHFVVCW